MATHTLVRNICFAIVFCFVFPPILFAQTPDADGNAVVANAQDPSDEIVQHINAMANIVSENMDKPDELKTKIQEYLQKNRKAMSKASHAFESKLEKMKTADAEVYRETMQRKMESSLNNFLSLMLQFSDRHPEEAKALDELLKGEMM